MEHCGILLQCDDGALAVYHTCKSFKSKFKVANGFLKKYPPDALIYMGNVEIYPEELHSFPSVRFNIISTVIWYFFTRHFFDWKPKDNCTMQTIKLLRYLGVETNDRVIPFNLYKELKENAHDNDCWESSSWKDYIGSNDC